MIVGTGIDLARVSRFKQLLNNRGFLNKYFHTNEIEYIESRGAGAAQSLAGRFAAREAFFKALGTGFKGFSPKDLNILVNENGKPYISPSDIVLKELEKISSGCKIHLSISHEKDYAIAQVILEA